MIDKITVVIVTYNGEQWINKCLSSIYSASIIPQVLVIDNNSTDETIQIIKSEFPDVMVVLNNQNMGFGVANNIGLKNAFNRGSDFYFLLNQDAWVEYDTFEKLINFQKKNTHIGILSPVHLNGDGNQLDRNFSQCIGGYSYDEILERERDHMDVRFVNAAAVLLTRELIRSIGGFDPIFKHYGEDRDYCNRALHHGFRVTVYTKSMIYHDRKYSVSNPFRSNKKLLLASGLAYVKNPNTPLSRNYIFWIFKRIPKFFKNLLLLHLHLVKIEIDVLIVLLRDYKQIKNSRTKCMSKEILFLNE